MAAALPGYDPTTHVATLKLTAPLPRHAAFQPYQAWVGVPLESRLIGWDWLAKDIKGYFFATAPADYDCHACTPLVAVVATALDGKERVVVGFTVLGPMGSFGTYSISQGMLRFAKIAPNKDAILFDDSDMHQGVKTTVTHVVSIEMPSFAILARFAPWWDSESACQGGRGCLSYKTEMRFVPPVRNGYYAIETVTSGHRYIGDKDGNTRPIKRAARTSFNGTSYDVAKIPD